VLGPIFSSALIGLMIGSLVFSPLSDRLGHRRLIVASALGSAITTFLTSLASGTSDPCGSLSNGPQRRLGCSECRGADKPVCAEAPSRDLCFCDLLRLFARLHGWGRCDRFAAAPLWLAFPVLARRRCPHAALCIPLSLAPRIARFPDPPRHGSTEDRGYIGARCAGSCTFTTDALAKGSPIRSLFENGRATGTVLLWVVFFLNLATLYALQSWLPTILIDLKYPLGAVALATSLSTIGGILVAVVMDLRWTGSALIDPSQPFICWALYSSC
jgi:MFS transporter, AAHS family, 4-hydroxybenzoate transporter